MRKAPFRSAAIFAALAAALAAQPASAEIVSASYRAMSKSEAILGGAPSALAAITASQSGASLTPTMASNFLKPAAARFVRASVSTSRPDVFNSVALNIDRSPLDRRWSQVSKATVGGSAGAFAAGLRGHDILAKLDAVNSYVNARVRFTDDRVQFGVADRWLTPAETLGRGRGDCEDFALAKRAMLRAAGVSDDDLYLVVLKDLSRRADHAVLVVRASGRFLVLDNGTNRIVDSDDVSDYRPVITFAANGRAFTHGYRRDTMPVLYASNRVTAPVALAKVRIEPSSGGSELPPVITQSTSLVPAIITF